MDYSDSRQQQDQGPSGNINTAAEMGLAAQGNNPAPSGDGKRKRKLETYNAFLVGTKKATECKTNHGIVLSLDIALIFNAISVIL